MENKVFTEAVLHCAAVPNGWWYRRTNDEMFDTIKKWHTDPKPHGNGWSDIGYHYVVMPDGSIYDGRSETRWGAHVLGYNVGRLGILMIERGKVDRIGKFHDYFNEKQLASVRRLVRGHPSIKKVTGHNDYAPKLCPGFKVRSADFM